MAYQRIQKESYTVNLNKMIGIIRNLSFARRVFTVPSTPIPIEKKRGQYFEMGERSGIQYNFDLVAPEYSRFSTVEKNPAIPVFQGNLAYTRHELKRVAGDILPIDQRQRLMLEQIVDDEERVAFAGDTGCNIPSFANTTYCSTAYASSLDLTTYATGVRTWHLSVSQIKALLKSKYQGAKLYQVWTPNVDERARSCLNTDETKTFYDYLKEQIGEKQIIDTGYLGSETGEGSANAALVPKDARNSELISSALESVEGLTTLKGLEVEVALRSRPVFYRGVKSSLYDASVDIAP